MILVFAESNEGKIKKSSLEAVSYGYALASRTNEQVAAIHIGEQLNNDALGELAKYGAAKIIHSTMPQFSAESWSSIVAETAKSESANVIVLSNTYSGKSLAPRVAGALKAAVASGIVDLPDTASGFKVKKTAFSGKAFTYVNLNTAVKVLAITPNSYMLTENPQPVSVSEFSANAKASHTNVVEVKKASGKIPLTEAEIVVSGGRGMKGPENWGMLEELANALNAATACSKPVSDMHWRSHEEHVGQTGITIKPNLYIAVGISGAIQHLAGVSSSKVICVINKDPEAPFFKAADYGIVGDAFEVIPQLIAAVKTLKANG